MDAISDILSFTSSPMGAAIFGGLWIISEALASVPAVKANSVFQLVRMVIEKLTPESTKSKTAN